MPFSVVMPALEMAQETGKLIAWRKREGESVTKGEPLLEIETDKAVMEVEAPADGILAGVSGQTGAEIPVGQTIAWIVAPGETPPVAAESAAPGARAKTESAAAPVATGAAQVVSSASARISPKARRLVKELGVDIATVRGSGSGGEILASDVQSARVGTAAPKPTLSERSESKGPGGPEVSGRSAVPADAEKVEIPTTLARLMAERTTQSWTTVPHFCVSREIDAGALNDRREKVAPGIERAHKVKLTHTDLLIALVARVLLKHPRLNASWTSDGIRLHDYVNMGVAIAVNDGVVAAVIPSAHSASLPEIAIHRRDIAERARAGKLRPADIADATFTISNLGMYQVDQFTAIITPPQAAVLAVSAIVDRVVAVGGKPVVRPMITLTLSSDHRVVDGARAALFMADLAEAIQEPQKTLSSS